MGIKYKILKIIGSLTIILVIGTVLDYFVHSLSPHFDVPGYYFRNKIIFGILYGLIALWLFKRVTNLNLKAVLFSLFISIILQTRYLIEGYDLGFVFLFMGVHFVVFLIPALIVFNLFPRLFRQ